MERRHGGRGGPLCGPLHQSQSRHPSDRHLGRTTGREVHGTGTGVAGDAGGAMRPWGFVISLVVERKMTAPRTGDRQFPQWDTERNLSFPWVCTETGGTCQSVNPTTPPPLLQHAHITSGNA